MQTILTYAIGGLVAFIVLWIGLSILWGYKWRPMQLKKGIPTPTFSDMTKRIVKFIFKEDTTPYKRIPFLNRKVVYGVLFVLSIALAVMGQYGPAAAIFATLIFVIFARTRGVFSQRSAALTRMYEVAASEFRYPRGTELNPWGMIQIQNWDELTIPGKTIVVFPAAFRSDDPRKRQDFENHFNATLGEDNTWSYDWDAPKGIVTCTPVSHIPEMAEYPGSTNHPWNEIPMGLGVDGEVVWDVSVAPHALVCGTTGGGKSVAQRSIVFHCIQHSDRWRFLGIDLKRVELSGYKQYDDVVMGIATEVEDAVEVVRFVYDEMMSRYSEMEAQGESHFTDLPNPPRALMLMVDEAYALMAPSGGSSDDAKEEDELKGEAAHLLGQVARLGRAAGVHMILATQRPDAKVIFGELKQNLAFRYGAGRMDSIASNMVLDSDAGTRTPGGIKGRAAISVFGVESYLQGYFAKPDWIDGWLAQNRPEGGPKALGQTMREDLPSDFSDGEFDSNYSEPRIVDNNLEPLDENPAIQQQYERENVMQGEQQGALQSQQHVTSPIPIQQSPTPIQSAQSATPPDTDFEFGDDEYGSVFGTPSQGTTQPSAHTERRPQLTGRREDKGREEDNWDDGMESIFAHVENMDHQPAPTPKKPQRLSQSAPMTRTTQPPVQQQQPVQQAQQQPQVQPPTPTNRPTSIPSPTRPSPVSPTMPTKAPISAPTPDGTLGMPRPRSMPVRPQIPRPNK